MTLADVLRLLRRNALVLFTATLHRLHLVDACGRQAEPVRNTAPLNGAEQREAAAPQPEPASAESSESATQAEPVPQPTPSRGESQWRREAPSLDHDDDGLRTLFGPNPDAR